MMNPVAEAVCLKDGHTMVSLFDSKVTEPAKGVTVEKNKIMCSKCGMSLDQIQNLKRRSQVSRQKRGPNGSFTKGKDDTSK